MKNTAVTKADSFTMLMELPLTEAIEALGDEDQVPLSHKIRQLVRRSLELLGQQGLEMGAAPPTKLGRGLKTQASIRRRLHCRRAS